MVLDLSKYTIRSIALSTYKESALLMFFIFNFVISFRIFNNTILQSFGRSIETVYLVVMIFYISGRILNRLANGNFKLNGFETMFAIYLLLPILPAISAYFVWDQPFYLGFLSYREFYLIGGALLLYNYCKDNVRKLLIIEKALVITAWITLIIFYLTTAFADPTQFLDTKIVSYSANRGGILLFKFNMGFVFFGTIYYFIKLFKTGKFRYLIYWLVFFIYILFIRQDRSSMISVVAAMGLFALFNINIKKQVIYFVSAVVPLIILVFVAHLLSPEKIEGFIFMFEDVFYALSGQSNPEVGMSVRIYETSIANTYIAQNPFLGNGKVSNYFVEGGFNGLFVYFYPTDIGLIGSIFTYGIPGTIVLYCQFFFVFFWAKRVKYFAKNVLFQACIFYLIILIVDSMTNGYLTQFAAQSITTIMIIYLYYSFDKRIVQKVYEQSLDLP